MARPSQKCARFLSENAALFPSPRKIHSFFARSFICVRNVCRSVIYDRKRWISKNPREGPQRSFEIMVLTTQNFREQISRCPVTKPYGKELTQPRTKSIWKIKEGSLEFHSSRTFKQRTKKVCGSSERYVRPSVHLVRVLSVREAKRRNFSKCPYEKERTLKKKKKLVRARFT